MYVDVRVCLWCIYDVLRVCPYVFVLMHVCMYVGRYAYWQCADMYNIYISCMCVFIDVPYASLSR